MSSSRRRTRAGARLLLLVWTMSIAVDWLIGWSPPSLRRQTVPLVLLATLLTVTGFVIAAKRASRLRPPAPGGRPGFRAPPQRGVPLSATAVGGPCDGLRWTVSTRQHGPPQQVWLPLGETAHRYHRTDEAQNTGTAQAAITYTYQPRTPER